MYKLIFLFFFFSIGLIAQEVPPKTNHGNSSEPSLKQEMDPQTNKFVSKENAVQMKLFTTNVQQIQSQLNTITYSSNRKSPSLIERQEMQEQLKELEIINAKSFEYNLLNYQVGNYDFSRIANLRAAEKQQPNNATVLKELSAYFYIMHEETVLKQYLTKLANQMIFSNDLQMYAENTLQSLPLKSILLTHGENDTYPLLIQQKIKNTRTDVEIISLDHLQSKEYRNRLKKSGFLFPKNDFIDTQFFEEFMRLNNSKNIIVAASFPRPYLAKGGKDLKSVGLGFNTSSKFDDVANVVLYEKSLKSSINKHVNQAKEKQILGNYLPFLFSVRNYYIENNNANKIDEVEVLILKIAELSNRNKQVNSLLNK
jgi:hypothetical protein